MVGSNPSLVGYHYNSLRLPGLGLRGATYKAPALASTHPVKLQKHSPSSFRTPFSSSFLSLLGAGGGAGCRRVVVMMGSSGLKTANYLRHVESLKSSPSGAGNIPQLNAVILGEALASEENDRVYPSDDFTRQALVPSPKKVNSFLCLFCFIV